MSSLKPFSSESSELSLVGCSSLATRDRVRNVARLCPTGCPFALLFGPMWVAYVFFSSSSDGRLRAVGWHRWDDGLIKGASVLSFLLRRVQAILVCIHLSRRRRAMQLTDTYNAMRFLHAPFPVVSSGFSQNRGA